MQQKSQERGITERVKEDEAETKINILKGTENRNMRKQKNTQRRNKELRSREKQTERKDKHQQKKT